MIHVVFMAGGKGTRFWPQSREKLPKQFLKVDGDYTLIESSLKRIESIAPLAQRWLVGSYTHAHLFGSITELLTKDHLILESTGRNTGPCMLLAACKIVQDDSDASIIFLPADHHIANTDVLCDQLKTAADYAHSTQKVVIIGIQPTHAFTGYGYIEVTDRNQTPFSVAAFKEKPDQKTADHYFASGKYFWNSGIYVVHAASFISLIQKCQPEMYSIIKEYLTMAPDVQNSTEGVALYAQIKSLSIEHTAIEKNPQVLALYPSQFDWNDVGSWGSLEDISTPDSQGNIINAKQFISVDSNNNIIVSTSNRLISLVDVHDMIVVDTDDAVLIMPKTSDQKVKEIVDRLPDQYR